MDPADYPMQSWSGHYPGPPQAQSGYPQSPTYSNINSQSAPSFSNFLPGQPYQQPRDPRGIEPGYYPHPRLDLTDIEWQHTLRSSSCFVGHSFNSFSFLIFALTVKMTKFGQVVL